VRTMPIKPSQSLHCPSPVLTAQFPALSSPRSSASAMVFSLELKFFYSYILIGVGERRDLGV